ncbi:RNA ligase-domain-containing protein [Panaeolus papilionaceus]|nr:RNA ligase-domain-containing protein [Panaeolus papilionaceus]
MVDSTKKPQTATTIDLSRLSDLTKDDGDRKAFITTKNHPSLPLSLHNYTKNAFMHSYVTFLSKNTEKLDLCLAARTLVTEKGTGKVVSRSFSKFFNYHEKLAYKPTGEEHAWVVEEKVDGSIISFFYYQGWQCISRGSFDSSHALQAKQVMDAQYPGVLQKLDEEKTYVFELIDPKVPIKVKYSQEGLILLSIISKDGSEPPHNFDWSILPFKRPYIYQTHTLELKAMSKLNLANEEGFVIKFWRTPDDRHPQRVKVKFESYLKLVQLKADASASTPTASARIKNVQIPASERSKLFSALPTIATPPTPPTLVGLYKAHRKKIPSFDRARVSNSLSLFQSAYLASLQDIADDYGGDAWLDLISAKWDRMHIVLSLQEEDWTTLMDALTVQRFRPSAKNLTLSPTSKERKAFDQRMKRGDVDAELRGVATAWWCGKPINKVVELVVDSWEIPKDMKSDEVILLGE